MFFMANGTTPSARNRNFTKLLFYKPLVGYAAVQKGSVPKSAWLPLWKSSTSCVLSNLVWGSVSLGLTMPHTSAAC